MAPSDQGAQLALGRCCRDWAAHLRARAQDHAPALSQAERIADSLLQARPQWAEVQLLRGSLWLERASGDTNPKSRRQNGMRAFQLLSSAITINPHWETRWRPAATSAKALADGGARP
jgi:hypothetical protein